MNALSDYLEIELLDHLLGTGAYSAPGTLHLALFTADPLDTGATGEVSGGSYARVAITNNSTNFPPCSATATNPVKSNGTTLTFPKATAAWGLVTHWAIFDHATNSTNRLWHGTLTTPRTVAINDTPKFAAGALTMSFTNSANGGLTAFGKRKLLDMVFGATAFASATRYTGLGTALSGDLLTEWSDTAPYARQSTAFDAAVSDTTQNASTITYATGVDVEATLTHFGIWDSVTAGNLLVTGPLNSSAVIAVGNDVTIPDSALTITMQ